MAAASASILEASEVLQSDSVAAASSVWPSSIWRPPQVLQVTKFDPEKKKSRSAKSLHIYLMLLTDAMLELIFLFLDFLKTCFLWDLQWIYLPTVCDTTSVKAAKASGSVWSIRAVKPLFMKNSESVWYFLLARDLDLLFQCFNAGLAATSTLSKNLHMQSGAAAVSRTESISTAEDTRSAVTLHLLFNQQGVAALPWILCARCRWWAGSVRHRLAVARPHAKWLRAARSTRFDFRSDGCRLRQNRRAPLRHLRASSPWRLPSVAIMAAVT